MTSFNFSTRTVLIDIKTGLATREMFLLLDRLNQVSADLALLVIIDSIQNGINDQAPSSNAVYDRFADTDNDIAAINAALGSYLLSADAATTYLTITDAGATYLTQGNAALTYLPLAGGNLTGPIRLPNYTVATLPDPVVAGAGALAFVTDALTTLALGLGTPVAAGGANKAPVYSDGTNWNYG